MLKKVKNSYFSFSKYGEKQKEEKVRRLSFFFLVIVTIIVCYVWGAILFYDCLNVPNVRNCMGTPIYFASGTIFVFFFIIPINIKSIPFELTHFLFNVVCLIAIASTYFGRGRGVHIFFVNISKKVIYGAQIFITSLIPINAILLSFYIWIQFFWVLVWVVVVVLIGVPYDLFVVDWDWITQKFRDNVFIGVCSCYTTIFIPVFVMMVVLLYNNIKRKKRGKLILRIASAIALLDTDSKLLNSFMGKKEKNCTSLEITFKKIIKNLELYICYIPEHLKSKNINPGINVDDDDLVYDTSVVLSDDKISKGSDTNSECSTSSTFSSEIKVENFGTPAKSGRWLEQKKITYVIFDIKEFHELMQCMERKNDGEEDVCPVISQFSAYVSLVQKISQRNKGILENIIGDKIIVSFNAVVNCFDHVKMGCTTALDFVQGVEKNEEIGEMKFTVIVTTGKAWCGSVGSVNYKRFVNIAPFINMNFSLKKISVCKDQNEIFATEKIYEKGKYNFLFRVANIVKFEGKNSRVYRLLGKNMINESQEWLYQIGDSLDTKNEEMREGNWEKVWNLIESGNFGMAGRVFSREVEMMMDEKYGDKKVVLDKIKKKKICKKV